MVVSSSGKDSVVGGTFVAVLSLSWLLWLLMAAIAYMAFMGLYRSNKPDRIVISLLDSKK